MTGLWARFPYWRVHTFGGCVGESSEDAQRILKLLLSKSCCLCFSICVVCFKMKKVSVEE